MAFFTKHFSEDCETEVSYNGFTMPLPQTTFSWKENSPLSRFRRWRYTQWFSLFREEMLGPFQQPMTDCCDDWCILFLWPQTALGNDEQQCKLCTVLKHTEASCCMSIWFCSNDTCSSLAGGGGRSSFVSKFYLDPLGYYGCECQASSTWLFTLRGPWEIGLAGASRYGLEPNFLWLISLATIPATVLISPQALCSLSVCLSVWLFSLSLHRTERHHLQKDITFVFAWKNKALSKCTTM